MTKAQPCQFCGSRDYTKLEHSIRTEPEFQQRLAFLCLECLGNFYAFEDAGFPHVDRNSNRFKSWYAAHRRCIEWYHTEAWSR